MPLKYDISSIFQCNRGMIQYLINKRQARIFCQTCHVFSTGLYFHLQVQYAGRKRSFLLGGAASMAAKGNEMERVISLKELLQIKKCKKIPRE